MRLLYDYLLASSWQQIACPEKNLRWPKWILNIYLFKWWMPIWDSLKVVSCFREKRFSRFSIKKNTLSSIVPAFKIFFWKVRHFLSRLLVGNLILQKKKSYYKATKKVSPQSVWALPCEKRTNWTCRTDRKKFRWLLNVFILSHVNSKQFFYFW